MRVLGAPKPAAGKKSGEPPRPAFRTPKPAASKKNGEPGRLEFRTPKPAAGKKNGPAWALVAAALATVSPKNAEAHLAPAVLGVVGEEGGAPNALRLAHGLATLDEQGRWRYVCPQTWAGPDAPLALAMKERRIAVIAASNAWELDPSGAAEVRVAPGLTTANARQLARGGDSVFALGSVPGAAIVVRFDAGSSQPVLSTPYGLDSIIAGDDRFEVARATPGGFTVERYDFDGEALPALTVASAEASGATITLERAHDALYAVYAKPSSWALARIDEGAGTAAMIATSTAPIIGPVEGTNEQSFVVINARLARIDGAALAIADDSQTYTCASHGYVCRRTLLYKLGDAGREAEPIFDLSTVRGPRLAHFDEDAGFVCKIEWGDFVREAGLDPTIPDADIPPKPEPEDGCGCRAAERGSVWTGLLLIGMIFAGRRRPDRR